MEANLTNKLLQAIAHGALSGDSSDEAVQRARNGEQIGAASSSGNTSSARAPAERKGERQGDAGSFEVAKREKRQAPQEGKRSDSSAGQKQSSSVGQKQSEVRRFKLSSTYRQSISINTAFIGITITFFFLLSHLAIHRVAAKGWQDRPPHAVAPQR